MKCFVTFRLKEGVTPEQYLEWFRNENVPAVRQMRSIDSYRVWRIGDAVEGTPSFEFLEEMELHDRREFERELEELPDVKAMLEGWHARVADQVVVYTEEVSQS